MIDSHCHLDLEQFNEDRSAVLERAENVGVNTIINPGAGFADLEAPIKVANEFSNVYAAVGVHPQEILEIDNDFWIRFEKALSAPKVIAIGEVGLEISDNLPPVEKQLEILKKFVSVASEKNKPLIFHVRYAHKEFQEFIKNYQGKIKGVMHCFSGTIADVEFYLSCGLYISIAGMITFPKSDALQEVVKNIPLESLLVETDAPLLAPQNWRGKRNEPAYVVEIARKIAEIKGVSLEEVDSATEANTRTLFEINK
jgi:TatD DNase family protein